MSRGASRQPMGARHLREFPGNRRRRSVTMLREDASHAGCPAGRGSRGTAILLDLVSGITLPSRDRRRGVRETSTIFGRYEIDPGKATNSEFF